MEFSKLAVDNMTYHMRAPVTEDASTLLNALGLSSPPSLCGAAICCLHSGKLSSRDHVVQPKILIVDYKMFMIETVKLKIKAVSGITHDSTNLTHATKCMGELQKTQFLLDNFIRRTRENSILQD